jgi:hypothetical protein
MIVKAHAIVNAVSQGVGHASHLAICVQFFTLIEFSAKIGTKLVQSESFTDSGNIAVEFFQGISRLIKSYGTYSGL